MHITKKIKCLIMWHLVVFWTLNISKKHIFTHFLAVLGLVKSEDLSEQKMTKLLKGAIVLFSNLRKAASIRGVS